MMYLGDFAYQATVDFMWSSNAADGSSITRATNGTISVYKGNSTTQTTTGVTDTEDFDALTGIHHCRIVTTDAFYAVGNNYMVVLSAATIDGKTVNAVLAQFSIENRRALADVVRWNGTAVAAPHTAGYPAVTIKDGTGTGEIDTASGKVLLQDGALTASVVATGAIDADALAADAGTEIGTAVWATGSRTLTAATNVTSTGAAVPITAGGLVSADVTAISTDTTAANNAEAFFDGTGYAGTNNVIPTVTTVNGLAANSITAAALAADAGAEIADAVWDEATAGHAGAGTTGKALTDANNGTPLDAAGMRGAMGLASANLDTQLDAIPTAIENADALLKRDWTAVTGEAARSVLNALRFLRNKWGLSGGTLTVTKEDDATTAWTASVTGTAGADPVTGVDPS